MRCEMTTQAGSRERNVQAQAAASASASASASVGALPDPSVPIQQHGQPRGHACMSMLASSTARMRQHQGSEQEPQGDGETIVVVR